MPREMILSTATEQWGLALGTDHLTSDPNVIVTIIIFAVKFAS